MKKQLSPQQHTDIAVLGYKDGPFIGDLIEFLEENNSIDLIRKSPIGNEWIINHPTTFGVEYIDKELCNCLWEAVKEVLGEL